MVMIQMAEQRWLPDRLIRFGMRRLLRERLIEEQRMVGDDCERALDQFAQRQRHSEVTIATDQANSQHYEVPAEFYQIVLGPRLKYSCGLWNRDDTTLAQSEEAMLEMTCHRAEISDGMTILDLGCGWGSLSLWLAEKFPNAHITALSNSHTQKQFILSKCREAGWSNVDVITADIGTFDTDKQFDRIVSIEMFEHVRNHDRLLNRIAGWVRPNGKLFVHIFGHRQFAYLFETEGEKNWMGRHFFSGGLMPAKDLLLRYQNDMAVTQHWWIDGSHYWRTCESWLQRLDQHRTEVEAVLRRVDCDTPAHVLAQRWRMFFMACAELFQFDQCQQWGVGHYLMEPHAPA